MRYNQHRTKVASNYIDENERILIDKFEQCVLTLKEEDKAMYTMIELGANQSYYSMLFQAILGREKSRNILLEPCVTHLRIGQEHFSINKFDGVFLNKSIGVGSNSTTIQELFEEQNIDVLDILHCDIDGAENELLKEFDFFQQKKIRHIFLLAHGTAQNNNIQFCTKTLTDCGYTLIYQSEVGTVGGDTLLLWKA